jgi:hypothetical protein
MKKILFLALLVVVLNAAARLEFSPTYKDVRFSAEVNNGYYGGQEGQIRFKVVDRTSGKDATVYAWLEEPLTMEDMRFKDEVLQWQIYYPQKTSGLISAGFNNWVPYYGRRANHHFYRPAVDFFGDGQRLGGNSQNQSNQPQQHGFEIAGLRQ